MSVLIRNICLLTILSGLIISAMPDGSVKDIANVFAVCVCVINILLVFKAFDYKAYASELAKYKEFEYELTASSDKAVDRLNRRVIEAEYSSYIVNEASVIGLYISEAKVTVDWCTDGYWIPCGAEIRGTYDSLLEEKIKCDLGIAGENITWIE